MVLNYAENLLFLVSTFTGLVSISVFASLVGIPLGITSSAARLKICVITAGIKNSTVKIVLLAKDKLNTTEILLSKDLVDSFSSFDEFVLLNNVLK